MPSPKVADRRPRTPDRFLDRLLPALPAVLLLLIFAAAAARAQDSATAARPATARLTVMVMPFDAPMGSLDRGRRFSMESVVPLVPMLVQGAGGSLPPGRFAEPAPASGSATPRPPTAPRAPGVSLPRTPPDDRRASRAEAVVQGRASEAAAVSDIGVAVAGLLTARLVADGRFRVLDAAQLAALRRAAEDCEAGRTKRGCGANAADGRPPAPGELYLVTGAILRLGPQEDAVEHGDEHLRRLELLAQGA